MRGIRARYGVTAAALALAAVATGCGGGGDGGDGDGWDPDREALPVSGGQGGRDDDRPSPAPARPMAEPLHLALVEREEPGACPQDAAVRSGYPDATARSCLFLAAGAPSRMTVDRLASVEYVYDAANGSGHLVNMKLSPGDARKFTELSAKAAAREAPRNRIAMVQNGRVVSAPVVMEPITGGTVQVSGNFTRETAQRLARDLGGG